MGRVEIKKGEVDEEWEIMIERLGEAIGETEELMKGKVKDKGWWDEECMRKKKEVRQELRKCRRNKGDLRKYREIRKEYKEL